MWPPTFPSPSVLLHESQDHTRDTITSLADRNVQYSPDGSDCATYSFRYIDYSSSTTPQRCVRLALLGEVGLLSDDAQASMSHISISCPTRATPSAHAYFTRTVQDLVNLADGEYLGSATIISRWVLNHHRSAEVSLHAYVSPFATLLPLQRDTIALLDVTLHRYDHYFNGTLYREYSMIVHFLEPIHPIHLQYKGYLPQVLSSLTPAEATAVVQAQLRQLTIEPSQTREVAPSASLNSLHHASHTVLPDSE
ncbi:hypothetical protein R3P38DRAFT_3010532 [Favolaschia claudopus]|uniref:Uncharacterized protein n=1 Tax=Favolaschia claudopus TaxID=2862362 RepID=A0AAW0AKK1_9AGAR